ncbi:MAG TPA: hypothetical protein VJW73_12195 [Gemmatimonadaceae bacterium]|nr:hypothetical protein [Gemmatimonadaceae bacterium]
MLPRTSSRASKRRQWTGCTGTQSPLTGHVTRQPEPRWWRILRGTAQAVGIIAVLGFALWRFSFAITGHPDEPSVTSVCRGAYAHARTRNDSASVDQQRPIVSRAQATVAVNCGTLRLAGELGPDR